MIKTFFFVAVVFISISFGSESGRVYVINGMVFTGDTIRNDVIIVYKGDRIEDVILANNQKIPSEATVIDAKGMTIIPGMIDTHVHFLGLPLPWISQINRRGVGRIISESISNYADNRSHFLENGVVAVMDMGDGLDDLQRIRVLEDKNKIIGPDIFLSGGIFTAPNGHPAGTIYKGQHDLIDKITFQVSRPDQATLKVVSLISKNVDFIKMVYSNDSGWIDGAFISPPRLDDAVAQSIVTRSHALHRKVFVHIGAKEEEAAAMVRAGVDGIEHAFVTTSDSLLEEMASKKIFFTPTLSVFDSVNRSEIFKNITPERFHSMQQTVLHAYHKGVPITVGTDFPGSNGEHAGEDIFKEMNLLERAGLQRINVLKAATSVAAEKAGRSKELGRIAPGYAANLVFFKGDIISGELSPDRIEKVLFKGKMLFESRHMSGKFRTYFKKKNLLLYPSGWYDPFSGFSIMGIFSYYNILNSGTSAMIPAAFSTKTGKVPFANLSLLLPSPFISTALEAQANYGNFSGYFYGAGNETEKDRYVKLGIFSLNAQCNATTDLFITKAWKLKTSIGVGKNEYSFEDLRLVAQPYGAKGGITTVISLNMSYNNLDNYLNPWHGGSQALEIGVSSPYMGSDYSFEKLTLDLRRYFSFRRKHVLAGRILYEQVFGNTPFYQLPTIDGMKIGRGYFPGRFSDKIGVFSQWEYRFPLWTFIGGKLFIDNVQFQENPSKIRIDKFHYGYGFGITWDIAPDAGVIMNIDFGFSPEGWLPAVNNRNVF